MRFLLKIFITIVFFVAFSFWFFANKILWSPFGKSEVGTSTTGSDRSNSRLIPVVLGRTKIDDVPVQLRLLGRVQPIASVAVRPRVEGQVEEIFVGDGALVKEGDKLARIDSRSIEARVRQSEANIERSKALYGQADRDVKRSETLSASEFSSKVTLENSRTQLATAAAQIEADQAALDDLRITQSFYTITAPISGRIGSVSLKPGSLAKTGDSSFPFVVINQVDPIYVSFDLGQIWIAEARDAIKLGTSKVIVTPQGSEKSYSGELVSIDNLVDQSSGTITVKAKFGNSDEGLWPGLICDSVVKFRLEKGLVMVPLEAIQTGQKGTFVYVVSNGLAQIRPITLSRYVDEFGIVTSGLKGEEDVVVQGQAQLSDGAKIVEAKTLGGQN